MPNVQELGEVGGWKGRGLEFTRGFEHLGKGLRGAENPPADTLLLPRALKKKNKHASETYYSE